MTGHPAETRKDHRAFCDIEGWDLVHNTKCKAVNHHLTYELNLADGRVLRTRVSHPVNKDAYGRNLWHHILRDQLDVSEDDFWACVREKSLPQRSTPPPVEHAVPVELFHLLVTHAGLPEREVLDMSKDEAIAAAAAHWSRPQG